MKITAITVPQAVEAVLKTKLEEKPVAVVSREIGVARKTLERVLNWIDEYGIFDAFDPGFIPPHRGNGSPELMYEMQDKQALWEQALFMKQLPKKQKPEIPMQLSFAF